VLEVNIKQEIACEINGATYTSVQKTRRIGTYSEFRLGDLNSEIDQDHTCIPSSPHLLLFTRKLLNQLN